MGKLLIFYFADIVKHTAWLNNFEGTLVIRTLGADRSKWKAIVAELASSDVRNFLLDIPYWYAKNFLVLVSGTFFLRFPTCNYLLIS